MDRIDDDIRSVLNINGITRCSELPEHRKSTKWITLKEQCYLSDKQLIRLINTIYPYKTNGVVNVLLTGTPVSPIEYKCPILHQKVMVAENSSSKHNIEYYLNKWQHQINEYIPRYNDNEYIIKWDAANNVAIVLSKNQEENTLHKTDDTKMGNNITRRINTHFYNKKTRHANVMFKIDCRDVDVVRAQYVVFRLLDDDIRKYIAYISNQEVSNECSIEKDGKLTAVTCSVTSTQRIPKLEGNEITTETQLSKTVEKDYNSNSVGNPDKFLAKSSGEVKQLVVVKHQECCIVM